MQKSGLAKPGALQWAQIRRGASAMEEGRAKKGNDRIDEVSTDSPIWTGGTRPCTDH
jgi:hypothetical protein